MERGALQVPGDVLVHLRRARNFADRHHAEPLTLGEIAGVAAADFT
jgi:hypothetical protein